MFNLINKCVWCINNYIFSDDSKINKFKSWVFKVTKN